MNRLVALIALIILGTIGYKMTENLSPDAQGIIVALGLVCLTLVSGASMVISSMRRQRVYHEHCDQQGTQPPMWIAEAHPPTIVQNHYHYHAPVEQHADRWQVLDADTRR